MNVKTTLAVGSIALDTLEAPEGRRVDTLGGSATYFSLTAALFSEVRLVGVVGTDFPADGIDLFRQYGINLDNLQTVEGSTFRWGGRYQAGFMGRDTLFTELGVFKNFAPTLIEEHKNSDILYLGNIQPNLQLDLIQKATGAGLIVSDTMNLWIDHTRDELLEVIAASDIFLINDDEARQLTQLDDLDKAARQLQDGGPQAVIIKLGSKGATIYDSGEPTHVPIYVDAHVVDPTGAGDSFAGGIVAHIAQHGQSDLVGAVINGTAAASFTVQGFGVEGLRTATKETILERGAVVASTVK